MEICYFARAVPEIEYRGGLFFIHRCDGATVVHTPAILAEFVAKAQIALLEMEAQRGQNVVPFQAAG